jgi:hypothetical protein
VSAVLLNIGAVASLWGVLWYMWDHNANAPAWLLGVGLTCLVTGSLLS